MLTHSSMAERSEIVLLLFDETSVGTNDLTLTYPVTLVKVVKET